MVAENGSRRRRFRFQSRKYTSLPELAPVIIHTAALISLALYIPKEMLVSLVQTLYTSPFLSFPHNNKSDPTINHSSLLPKSSLFPPSFERLLFLTEKSLSFASRQRRSDNAANLTIRGSLLETPVLWVGRICIFYALVKSGVVGSKTNPLVFDLDGGGTTATSVAGESGDLGFSKWLENIRGKPDKEAADKRKLVSKWHPTTKGTLRRNYRVPSKSEGRRLLKAIASLLSDDHFTDATSHKGCQIRRESAHGESVCCNNVRALFDELPTPHLIVEITPFPAGPLTERDYGKAEKLERLLRSGPSV